MKIMTPEEFLGKEKPKIKWHHGTCDMCKERLTLVCHFGYDQQLKRSYRICKNCMFDNIQYILYGSHGYKDGLIDLKDKDEKRKH